MTLLGRRDYTAAELQNTLSVRGYPDDEVTAAIARLAEDKLIDDRRVAAAFVRTAVQVKGRGRHRIQRELEARGVNRALIQELIASLAPDDEAAAIEQVLARRRTPARPSTAERRRLFQHLLRRGFSVDGISKALRKRCGTGEEE